MHAAMTTAEAEKYRKAAWAVQGRWRTWRCGICSHKYHTLQPPRTHLGDILGGVGATCASPALIGGELRREGQHRREDPADRDARDGTLRGGGGP